MLERPQKPELWFKEDLATVSGPLGRRGPWHEILSSFNLTVCYIKGEENTVADILSRWTYEACQDNDTNMHGGEADLDSSYLKKKKNTSTAAPSSKFGLTTRNAHVTRAIKRLSTGGPSAWALSTQIAAYRRQEKSP